MIFLDYNNLSTIKYSSATSLLLKELNIKKKDWKESKILPEINSSFYITQKKAFFNLFINELKPLISKFSKDYGELVICRDFDKKNYWRKELYKPYKANRDKESDEFDSLIEKYNFDHKSELLALLKANFKVIEELSVHFKSNPDASIEADEIIATLTTLPGKHLIISNDGDFHQLLIKDIVKIYNPFERKLITKTKKEINEKNIRECLVGQAKDNIVSIKHNSEISNDFINWMKEKHNLEITKDMILTISTKYKSYMIEYSDEKRAEDDELIKSGKRKKRRNLTAFSKPDFGLTTCEKWLKEYSLEEILNMNPIYRARYNLNERLYRLDKVPEEVKNKILDFYNNYEFKKDTMTNQQFMLRYGISF